MFQFTEILLYRRERLVRFQMEVDDPACRLRRCDADRIGRRVGCCFPAAGLAELAPPGRRRQKSLIPEPGRTSVSPGRIRPVGFTDAEVVGGVRINVQLRRDACSLKRKVRDDAMLRRADDIVAAVNEEDRWRVGGYVQARSDFIFILVLEITRIHQDREVGSATQVIDVVNRVVTAFLEACGRRNRQMAAGGKTDYADVSDAPLPSPASHQAHRALCVLHWTARRLFLGFTGTARHTILQDDPGDSNRVQPGSDFFALELPIQIPVSPARAN